MDQKQALAEKLKSANNILVTVSSNPSVDQLASCIGLTLALNKLNKHATAVFSGEVPNTLEFLQPEKTLEKNTDSLRDFIISLDKAKADKLRYKVEDKVVKIFITPYRTSIDEKDLEFSQGDFNVDAVVAIGVHGQAELDQAITAHGRILHDATVATLNTKAGGELGAINWVDPKASSLSELAAELVTDINKEILDAQMATAFLTGIVAETKRFSNDKTSPMTMTISAELMAAGANQQLVATKLDPPKPPAPPPAPVPPAAAPPPAPQAAPLPPAATPAAPLAAKPDDGTLEIAHNTDVSALEDTEGPKEPELTQINIDDQGSLHNVRDLPQELPKPAGNTDPTKHMAGQHMILEPPSMGGQLTASVVPEDEEERPAGDPLANPASNSGLLQRAAPVAPPPPPTPFASPPADPFTAPASMPTAAASAPDMPPFGAPTAPAPSGPLPQPGPTLTDIEATVHSPHLQPAAAAPWTAASPGPAPADPFAAPRIDTARDAVMQAIAAQPAPPTPIQALNAQPLGAPLHDAAGGPGSAPVAPPPAGPPPPPMPPPMMPPSGPPFAA